MSNEEKNQVDNQAEPAKSSNRRRFLRHGVMAAPVITTLASRPVWAGNDIGIAINSISGNLSGNLSTQTQGTQEPITYNGCGDLSYWSDESNYSIIWNDSRAEYDEDDGLYKIHFDTDFRGVFTKGPKGRGFAEIVQLSLNTPNNRKRYVNALAASALLNSITDASFPYAPDDIIDLLVAVKDGSVKEETGIYLLEKLGNTAPCAPAPEDNNSCNNDGNKKTGKKHTHGRGHH